MTTNASGSQKPTDRIDQLALLGTDAAGAEHRLDTTGRVVYVLRDGEVQQAESIRNRGLEAWVQYVADRRGWAELHVDERPVGTWLADALEVA